MNAPRGAAVPETAIVLGVVLTLLFGTFELGLIGLMQLGGDGAAFLAAHASVLGKDPRLAISGPFPNVARTATVTVQSSLPDPTNIAVDYNLAASANRHGGVQVVRPTHTQATVANDAVGIGSILPKTRLSNAFIEANMMVSGVGFGVFGNPLNSAADFATQKTYFADDGNAPPYFIGLRYVYHCRTASTPATQAGCDTIQPTFAAGLAEYLDGSNWARPQNGIGSLGVYEAMSIHQQVYAAIARRLSAMTSVAGGGENTVLDPKQPCLQTANSWDIPMPPGYVVGTTAIGKYPLNPLGNLPGCP
ncbi:MAG: hypothetical protein NVS4B13_04480 [Candidatus Elarobacter sp.]